jgi:peptide/nickel transport system substrate-binding protein
VAKSLKFGILAIALVAAVWAGMRLRPGAATATETRRTLVASLRSEPTTYNRYKDASAATELLSLLTHATLVRIDRMTGSLEPALAESWTASPDGRTFTLNLRKNVRFSDGTPFTSSDVIFSADVVYDAAVASPLASALMVDGKPLDVRAVDDLTVTVTLPSAFAPGLGLLDNLPILPRHKLEAAFKERRFDVAWAVGVPLTDLAGLGPFVLAEHASGQRLTFKRNPNYWRQDEAGIQLPYLDELTIAIVADQNTEAVRMDAGDIDLMANGDLRADDYATFKRAADQGRLRLLDAGIGLDPNLLWFNLTDAARPRIPWLHDKRVRQAISFAIDRQAIVDTVYLGAAVPIFGPVSPGNRVWASASAPRYPHDPAKARTLLASAGFADRNNDRMLEDAGGKPIRFSVLTQKGHTARERTTAVIQNHLQQVGMMVDVVALDPTTLVNRWQQGDYESAYFGTQASSTDPALNLDFWLSSGGFHPWNPSQKTPATGWEAQIDRLMARQATAPTLEERQQLFAEVQRIFGEELPAIYFAAPKVTVAVSPRVGNPRPVQQIPQLLWSADTLSRARQ